MKITRVIVCQGGTVLRIQFNGSNEVVVPSPRKLSLFDTVMCRGTKLYVRGKFLVDAKDYVDVAWDL